MKLKIQLIKCCKMLQKGSYKLIPYKFVMHILEEKKDLKSVM